VPKGEKVVEDMGFEPTSSQVDTLYIQSFPK